MVMADPGLLECWGSVTSGEWRHDPRQKIYLNLILSYWEMMYEVGEGSMESLRENVRRELFSTQLGYDFWTKTRKARLVTADNARKLRFWKIVDAEYSAARPPLSPMPRPHGNIRPLAAALGSFGLGVAAGTVISGLRRKRSHV
jgi:hypothetical protein